MVEVAVYAAVEFQFFVLPVHGCSERLVVVQSVSSCIVCVAYEAEFLVSLEGVDVHAAVVSVVCAVGGVGVAEESFLFVFFDGDVEYGAFVAVVDACDACHVAFFVVGFDFVDDFGGYVLEYEVSVVAEELFSVHEYLADVFAVECESSVFVYDDARQFLDEFFHHGAFGQFEGVGVVGDGVVDYGHFWQFAFDYGFGHDGCVLAHHDVGYLEVAGALWQVEFELLCLEAHERYLQGVCGGGDAGQEVLAVLLGCGAGYHRVAFVVEFHGCAFHAVECFVFEDCAADIK